jgi:hypothetical protein
VIAMIAQTNLGFGGSPRPTRIFIGKELGALWYFWNSEKSEPEVINSSSLTGYIRSIARRESVSDYGVSEKLIVGIEADRSYEIVCGLHTWFSKSLLLALNELDETALARTISIEPTSNSNTKKVVFTNVYNWQSDRVFPSWKWRDDKGKLNEPNLDELIDSINSRLKFRDDEIIDLEEEHSFEEGKAIEKEIDVTNSTSVESENLVSQSPSQRKKDAIPF